MKKVLFGCAVAVLALFSACENLEPQVQTVTSTVKVNTEDAVIFTADLGVDTKTYLEFEEGVYKTRWSRGDRLFILGTSEDGAYSYETVDLIEGAGTSVGTFAGTVKADQYFAFYGPGSVYPTGEWEVELQQYQYSPKTYDEVTYEESYLDNIDGAAYFPMYAKSTTTEFNFQNLCSILKIGLSGTDYIDNIIFAPNDTTLKVAGAASVEVVDGEPQLSFLDENRAVNHLCYYFREVLDETEVKNCYISIPPQTYKGGFKLTINSDKGSMEVNVTDDITFERSQIRAIPEIKYVNQTLSSWGLIGSMTEWAKDIPMGLNEGVYTLIGQYLEAGDEVKFRSNGSWDVNIGAGANQNITPGEVMQLSFNGNNLIVTQTGYYDIYLDVANAMALFELQELDYVECESYDEVAALEDGTKVLVQGYVFVPYGRGFVMNIGPYFGNCILVYQGTDQSLYTPVMGNEVLVLAEKVTYNNLPELTNIEVIEVVDDGEQDFGYNQYFSLYDAAAFDSQQIGRYEYVKFAGTLEYSNNYYNVIVEGATVRTGTIEFPIQDLTEFIGKKVNVEGWFIGFTGGGKYLKIVLRAISEANDSGSTEDVIPGDDIVVTSKASSKVVE